jgi:trehalose 6-phosphate phosphatase
MVWRMERLEQLREAPERAAIILDIDGTLAPIVDRPEDAGVPEGTRGVLRDLVGRYALVAAVTGREGGVGRKLVGVEGIVVIGNHGLELDARAEEWRARLQDFSRALDWPVEDKGLSISLHYRTAADPDAARAALEDVAEQARKQGFKTRFGRMVLEVVPPIDANKGTAVHDLLARASLTRALFAGDDTTDLDAFAAIEQLEVGVKVAVESPEGPEALRDRADIVVAGTGGLVDLLREL